MSLYGAAQNGARIFQAHQRQYVEQANTLANGTFEPADQEELTLNILRMDRAKQYLDFANGIVEDILKNLSSIQP